MANTLGVVIRNLPRAAGSADMSAYTEKTMRA
jgi:hypothetical protein